MKLKISTAVKYIVIILLFSTTGVVANAMASPILDQAKEQCIVGESASGYLGYPKGSADPNVQREVREINLKRKAVYTDLANKSGVTVDGAAAITGEKLVARAPRGQCVQNKSGQWITVK